VDGEMMMAVDQWCTGDERKGKDGWMDCAVGGTRGCSVGPNFFGFTLRLLNLATRAVEMEGQRRHPGHNNTDNKAAWVTRVGEGAAGGCAVGPCTRPCAVNVLCALEVLIVEGGEEVVRVLVVTGCGSVWCSGVGWGQYLSVGGRSIFGL